ncbi:MAG: arsenate reductase ArsC [Calditrichales bacterium]|nr:MAG: arsenate reductase ArsC [Calditrichales bacterium]
MKRILFLCTANSTLSQMAEAFLKRITFGRVEVHSAGIKTATIHPMTIKVMKELGVDITQNRSKSANEYYHQKFDYVITIHDKARENCPAFQGSHTKIHKSLEDPADIRGSEANKMEAFRNTRDQIKDWLTDFAEKYQLS